MTKAFPILLQRARPRAFAAALTFAAVLAGCDNVQWGGIQVSITKPTAEREFPKRSEATDTMPEPPPVALPTGPVVFHVRRLDPAGRATIEPVAELVGGELVTVGADRIERSDEYAGRFNQRFYSPGVGYTLFRGGTRAGTFVVSAPIEGEASVCPRLRAAGQIELIPRANALAEFLAWPPGVRVGRDSLSRPVFRSEMNELAEVLVRRGVQQRAVAGEWRFGSAANLRPLAVGTGSRGFAATFMIGDSLAEGPPADSAGMAFIVADYDPLRGYFPLYFDAAWYRPGEKRALRWIDAVDLTGDARDEWLLRAHGDVLSWYEVIGRGDMAPTVVWSSRTPACEAIELSSG